MHLDENIVGIVISVGNEDNAKENKQVKVLIDVLYNRNTNQIIPFGQVAVEKGSGASSYNFEDVEFYLHTMNWDDPEYIKGTHSISNLVFYPYKNSTVAGETTFRYELNNIMLRGHIDPNIYYFVSGYVQCELN